MKVSLNILTKDPSKCESKTRLKDILTDKEREFITKEMLNITCKSLSDLKCDKYIFGWSFDTHWRSVSTHTFQVSFDTHFRYSFHTSSRHSFKTVS